MKIGLPGIIIFEYKEAMLNSEYFVDNSTKTIKIPR